MHFPISWEEASDCSLLPSENYWTKQLGVVPSVRVPKSKESDVGQSYSDSDRETMEQGSCPVCGGELEQRDGANYCVTSDSYVYPCNACGHKALHVRSNYMHVSVSCPVHGPI